MLIEIKWLLILFSVLFNFAIDQKAYESIAATIRI